MIDLISPLQGSKLFPSTTRGGARRACPWLFYDAPAGLRVSKCLLFRFRFVYAYRLADGADGEIHLCSYVGRARRRMADFASTHLGFALVKKGFVRLLRPWERGDWRAFI
jgi:hypothetical protein